MSSMKESPQVEIRNVQFFIIFIKRTKDFMLIKKVLKITRFSFYYRFTWIFYFPV